MLKRNFLEILRWGLRLHGIGHLVEVVSAVSEGAYITATLALIFISIELLASFYLPKEHVHFKPIKSDVHEDCKDWFIVKILTFYSGSRYTLNEKASFIEAFLFLD